MYSGHEKMKINLIDDVNSIHTIELDKEKEEAFLKWSYNNQEFKIEIITDLEIREISSIQKSHNWIESEAEIKQKFFDAVFEYKMELLVKSEDGFDDANEDETGEIEKYNPYNPKLIRVDTKTFSIDMVNDMINEGEIDLSPDFQRGFVWTDITRKSRLIESLLLRIPV